MDILRDGWDSWGEWERRWESGRVVREGRVGWGGGEGKGREEEERKGRMMGMKDEDGMVYVYMIVQMSTNIRDLQTPKSESFLWGKKVIM